MTLPGSEIVRIPFHGSEVHAVDIDGKPFVVFRPVVESIGLDYSTQIGKLRNRSWANRRDVPTVAADGKVRMMAAIDVSTLLMWLATVNETKVALEVRPLLVAYQRESADAINGYWTEGGAINPRATQTQIETIIAQAEGQARVLSALNGIVDPTWLEAKARHVAALALGEEPEIDPLSRPLTVGEYLESKGITGAALRSMSPRFGTKLKKLYIAKYGVEPGKSDRFVDGALRPVAVYTEAHRPMFDQTFRALVGAA